MAKKVQGIAAQGGSISKMPLGPKSEMNSKNEESKLDPLVLSGDSSRAVTEGGLILSNLPPSTTHTKNT